MLSRWVQVFAALVMVGSMVSTGLAQQGGNRGGPGGRFGGGMGAGGGASDVMGLLAAPEVRKEVKLSDEGYAALEKLQKEIAESRQALFAGFGRDASEQDREKARESMMKQAKESNEKAQAMLDEVLPPEGLDRLLGLYVQLRGDATATGELVSKKLGLSDADKSKINEAVNKVREEAMAAFRPQGGGQPGQRQPGQAGGFNPEDMRARFEEMQKKVNEAASAAMSDDQKKALADLKGAKFEFPESVRTMGRGFGGPGGPGGQPAPGGPGSRRGNRPGADSGT